MHRYALIMLLTTACSKETPAVSDTRATVPIACALAGADAFAQTCSVDRVRHGNSSLLTLYAPGGGFRRITVANDGAIAAADGSEPALVGNGPRGEVEVRIAGDRYRLPPAPAT